MTISFNGAEFGQAIAVASVIGSIVSFLIVALIIYLVVRPPRRRREARPEAEAIDAEEMLALMERMERRLEVLERAVRDETAPRQDRVLETAEAPEARRVK